MTTYRIVPVNLTDKVKYRIDFKRGGRWCPLRIYGCVKAFDNEFHANNYLNKIRR